MSVKKTDYFPAAGAAMPCHKALPHIPILFAGKVNHLFTSSFEF